MEKKLGSIKVTIEKTDEEGNVTTVVLSDRDNMIMGYVIPDGGHMAEVIVRGTRDILHPIAVTVKEAIEKHNLLAEPAEDFASFLAKMLGMMDREGGRESDTTMGLDSMPNLFGGFHNCKDCASREECDLPSAVEYRAKRDGVEPEEQEDPEVPVLDNYDEKLH